MSKKWGTNACPRWCASDHGRQTHPEDRVHTSDGLDVAAVEIVGIRHADGWVWRQVAVEWVVAIEQPAESTPGLLLVDESEGRQCLMTLESARRLIAAMQDELRRAG